jgi:hypothetical protein
MCAILFGVSREMDYFVLCLHKLGTVLDSPLFGFPVDSTDLLHDWPCTVLYTSAMNGEPHKTEDALPQSTRAPNRSANHHGVVRCQH